MRRGRSWRAAGAAASVMATLALTVTAGPARAHTASRAAAPSSAAAARHVRAGGAHPVARAGVAITAPTFGAVDASGSPGPQSEATIAVDPLNPRIIVAGANDLSGAGVAAFYTEDGGRTWGRVELPLQDAISGDANASEDTATDPSLVAASDGTFYFSYTIVNGDGSAASVVVSASHDGGRTWSVPAVVTPGITQKLDNDKDALAVDGWTDPHAGYLYDVWDQNEPNGQSPTQEVMLSYAPPGGTAWSKPRALNLSFGSGEAIYGEAAVLPDGSLYVLWDDYGMSDERSLLAGTLCTWKGADLRCGSPHFIASSNVNINGPGPVRNNAVDCQSEQLAGSGPQTPNDGWDCYAIPPQPARGIAAAPAVCAGPDGVLHMAFDTARSPGSPDTEVVYSGSTDGGASWSPPTEIDGDQTGAYDFFPWIACDPTTGALAVAYYSTRGDASGASVHEYLTWSASSGTTWTPPQAVSPVSSNETVPAADNNDYGDYEGLALVGDVAYPAWTARSPVPGVGEQIDVAGVGIPVPPAAPAGLSAHPSTATAETVVWPSVPAATYYDVYGVGGAAPALLASGLDAPRFTAAVGSGIAVQAVDPAGAGPMSAPFAVPPPAAPGAVLGVAARADGATAVALSWTSADQAARYAVLVDGARDVMVSTPSAVVAGLSPAHSYTFSVVAENALGSGPASSTVTEGTPPEAPQGLRAKAGSSAVVLAWTPVAGATRYTVERNTQTTGDYAVVGTTARATWTDHGVRPATTYWYTVTAAGATGVSAPAPSLRVRTSASAAHTA